jgi:predicted RNase H-like HicB family nuclease
MRIEVTFEVSVPFVVKKEGKWFVSSCPVLDVCSQGPTRKKARGNLVEALQLFLVSCYERGTLSQVLRESGFVPRRTSAGPRRSSSQATPRTLRVPLAFTVDRPRGELWPA